MAHIGDLIARRAYYNGAHQQPGEADQHQHGDVRNVMYGVRCITPRSGHFTKTGRDDPFSRFPAGVHHSATGL